MLRKRWQPRRLRASFPPMPSPATSDRRAYHRLALPRRLPPLSGRCSDDNRPNALSPTAIGVTTSTIAFSRLLERRAQTEARCAVFAVRFVRGSGGARVHTTPWPWLENCRNRADCDNICGGTCEPQKHLRVGEEWAGTDILRTDCFASAQNGLNVFGCSRLAAGIGFLRLPASSTSGVTGVLTYPRKPGGA